MVRVLFIGTAENRFYNRDDDDNDDYKDMPCLINMEGQICNKDDSISDLEKYKNSLFIFLKNIIGESFYYNTIDPSYTNNIKSIIKEDKYYLGHISSLLHLVDPKFHNHFDYIIVTNCYRDLFNKSNIDKLNLLSKYNNKIYIINEIQYIINDYMKNNLQFQFISP
tara:strand:+ start:316 stop:813 length:498 start_codon:yes stop_codon:yes gene_type:complete